MDRVFESGAAETPPDVPATPSSGYPTPGNPSTAMAATKPGAHWYYMITEEMRGVIASAGITPDPANVSQLAAAINAMIGNALPAGMVVYVSQSSAPSGFLKANGAAVSRATYAALFAKIGSTFGAGDGVNTFNLPDLRGEFIRGFDDGRGIDTGRTLGSSQLDAFQGHWHTMTYAATSTIGSGGSSYIHQVTGGNNVSGVTDAVRAARDDGTNGTPRTAAETRPRNVALLACIKF